jgi:hypothetical protein
MTADCIATPTTVREPPEQDAEFYRSRIVVADFAGATAAFGPVHTAQGLADLTATLQARGWSISGDLKLTSLAKLKDHSC